MVKKLGALCVAACLPACLLADFSYEQTTKMTGGAMMGMMRVAGAFSKTLREPIQNTVAVKGNKMVHGSKDRADIIDLDSETITAVDFQKKTYAVMTFAEMTEMMERAMQQMKDKKNENKVDADFKISLKSTGASKQIAGYDTKEMLMSFSMEGADQKSGQKGGMIVTSSMWIAPKISGYDEMREFHKRMAAKLRWTPGGTNMMGAMGGGNPDVARGMAEVSKEAAKMDGMPILQVMKMTPSVDGKPVEGAQQSSQSKPKAESPSLSGALAGRLGGLGGFGRKKKQEEPKEEAAAPAAAAETTGEATLMEMTTQMAGFSSASVDASRFVVPAGFKKVESEAQKRAR